MVLKMKRFNSTNTNKSRGPSTGAKTTILRKHPHRKAKEEEVQVGIARRGASLELRKY